MSQRHVHNEKNQNSTDAQNRPRVEVMPMCMGIAGILIVLGYGAYYLIKSLS